MTGLHISPTLDLDEDFATESIGIVGIRGSGKSNTGVVLAEEMYDAGIPWAAIDPKGDWWGIRSSADGKGPGLPVAVFGGLHGDLPLEHTAGNLVADLIVDHNLTAVLDVSRFSGRELSRFLVDFCHRILWRHQEEPHVRHIFFEEAHRYIPQQVTSGTAAMKEACAKIPLEGRSFGLGSSAMTQRPARLHKDVTTQVGTFIAMRVMAKQDRDAVAGWILEQEFGKDALATLSGLQPGEAWILSPLVPLFEQVTFRQRRTFDSGATPKVGQVRRKPATVADVDLVAIGAAMADTIEKAKADDPKTLRARIRDLERELDEERARRPEPVEVRVEVPVLAPEIVDQLEALLDPAAALLGETQETLLKHRMWAEQQLAQPKTSLPGHATSAASSRPRLSPARETPRGPTPPAGQGTPTSSDDVQLRKGARRMVEALGRMAPLRLTTSQWGTVAHLKTTGGTWSTYLSDIRRAGFVDEGPAGWTLTDAGFDYLGGRPDPMTAAELQDHYRSILRAGAVKMLDALLEAHPDGLTRGQLGAAADIAITGGTFSTYLSDLVRNGLAEKHTDVIVAADLLVYGADA